MAWDDSNLYYSPEKFGLQIVADIEWDDESYEFNQTVIWKDAEGQLYIASDSGCSCPLPFEYARTIDDLTKVTRDEAIAQLTECAQEGWEEEDGESYHYGNSKAQRQMLAVNAIAKLVA
jgi:hypothetical protein